MTKTGSLSVARIALASSAAMLMAACSSTGHYRVGAVGDVPGSTASTDGGGTDPGTSIASTSGAAGSGGMASGATATGTGTSTSGAGGGGGAATGFSAPLLVSAGNAVIGVAGRQDAAGQRLGGVLPATGRVDGVVTAVLRRTGQTLVDVGGGRSVVLNRAAGRLGDAVAIDLGSRKVVGAPTGSALLGLGVASATPPTGTLGSVNVASGGLGALTGAAGSGGGTATGIVPRAATTVASVASGTPVGTVTGAVPTPTAPITRPVGGIVAGVGLGAGAATSTGSGTTTGGALGVGGLVRIKRP